MCVFKIHSSSISVITNNRNTTLVIDLCHPPALISKAIGKNAREDKSNQLLGKQKKHLEFEFKQWQTSN